MLRETSNNRSCQIVSVTDGVVTYLVRRSVTARQILTTIILVRFRNKLLYSTWGLQNFNRIEINPLKQIRCKMSTIEICLSLGQVFRERLSSSQSIRNALTPNRSFGILCCHIFFFSKLLLNHLRQKGDLVVFFYRKKFISVGRIIALG